jgi:hypothetical protein
MIASVLALVLAGTTIWLGRDEYRELARERGEPIGTQTAADEKIAPGELRIGAAERSVSGIETAPLAAAEADATIEIYGAVVDLKGLVEARGRIASQDGTVRTLRTAATLSEAEYQRAAALFKDDRNVSERTLLAAEAQWKGDRERLAAAETEGRSLREALGASWGGPLAVLAAVQGSPAFAALIDQREVIVQMTVPPEHDRALAVRPLFVEASGGGTRARAQLVSAAPGTTPGAVGTTWFFRVPAAGLRAGARVTGYLSTGAGKARGVVVPERAVVWHAGRPWVYVQHEADRFVRTPVSASRLVEGGWFNAVGFEPGVQVAVTGAQLLLSEELEYRIRNENED